MNEPISFSMAKNSGQFSERNNYLRPNINSGIAEYFGHTKEHNNQAYVIPANNEDTEALIIGGSKYSLKELAICLNQDIEEYKKASISEPNEPSEADEKKQFLDTIIEHYKFRGVNPELLKDWYIGNIRIKNYRKELDEIQITCFITSYFNDKKIDFQRIGYRRSFDIKNKENFKRLNFEGNIDNFVYIPCEWKAYEGKPLIICEGVPDALTYLTCGFMSIGLRSKTSIKNISCQNELRNFIKIVRPYEIIVIPDSDAVKEWSETFVKVFKEIKLIDLQQYDKNLNIGDANNMLVNVFNNDKDRFTTAINELIEKSTSIKDNSEEHKKKTDEAIDKLREEIFSEFYYNKEIERIYNTKTKECFEKSDFKLILKVKLSEITKTNTSEIRDKIYSELLLNSDNYLHGNFRIELGLNNLNGNEIIEVDNRKYLCDLTRHKPFKLPNFEEKSKPFFDSDDYSSLLSLNKGVSVWDSFLMMFEKPRIAYYTFQIWLKNIKLTYEGKMRPNPIFPIIYGKQGVGKDYYIFRFLTSVIPSEYILYDGTVKTITDERKFFELENALVMLFPEMQKFDKADTNAIKSFITSPKLSYRVLASHKRKEFANLTNCIGSTNKEFDEIFRDTTGERRFVQLKLLDTLTLDDVKNVIVERYKKDSSCLYKTVDPGYDFKDEVSVIREYQENEMRHKSEEEIFIFEYLVPAYTHTENNDDYPNIDEIRQAIKFERIVDLNFLTSAQIFDHFKKFLSFIENDTYLKYTNKLSFGKKIRPLMEKTGLFVFDANNRRYKRVNAFLNNL